MRTLAAFGMGIVVTLALALASAETPEPPAPSVPFAAELPGWIERGVPIAAVAELEGRRFLIFVNASGSERWSVAVDPGATLAPPAPPAPVALGPDGRRSFR